MASSSSATVAVEKATSDLLISPDWTINIEICDSINSSQWQAKDVIKALKKRLQHKNPKVQFLSLTLLETMVKNCGDYVHFQIADRNILEEMVKIVKKKADMQVRDKILVLLDSWQEAFGGPGGKYPQYYWAFEELRRSGVVFPNRSSDAAPIFTPPITNPTTPPLHPGYGMPTNSSRRLDETMATGIESLSSSSLDAMRDVADLLTDMLQAVNPGDSVNAVKDEVIGDLVLRCHTNQKKLMQMLTTTGEEELLGRGLELNDRIQSLLARHDALASGSPLPIDANFNIPLTEASSSTSYPAEGKISSSEISAPASNAGIPSGTRTHLDDEEDEFAQLARRHLKPQPGTDGVISNEGESVNVSIPSNALTIADPPAPVRITKEQDLIDLLSMNLSMTTTVSADSHQQTNNQNMHQVPVSPGTQENILPSQTHYGRQGHVQYDSYVVPWAQTQPSLANQLQYETQQQSNLQHQSSGQQQFHHHPRSQMPQFQHELQVQHQAPFVRTQGQHQSNHLFSQHQQFEYHVPSPAQLQGQELQQTEGTPQGLETQLHNQYPPSPRWAATPAFPYNQNDLSPTNASRPFRVNYAANSIQKPTTSPLSHAGQKPFVPSYKLFEDLNVFGNADGKQKMTASGPSSGLSGSMGPGMMGGSKT